MAFAALMAANVASSTWRAPSKPSDVLVRDEMSLVARCASAAVNRWTEDYVCWQ